MSILKWISFQISWYWTRHKLINLICTKNANLYNYGWYARNIGIDGPVLLITYMDTKETLPKTEHGLAIMQAILKVGV